MKLKILFQETLKSKQIEIKRIRIRFKTNNNKRTQLNFQRLDTNTKAQERKKEGDVKKIYCCQTATNLTKHATSTVAPLP